MQKELEIKNIDEYIAIVLLSQWIPRYWARAGSSGRWFLRVGGFLGQAQFAGYVGRRSGRGQRNSLVEQL